MEKYDYLEHVKQDVDSYVYYNIGDNDTRTREELEEFLNDELWAYDPVTGNASGSYTFNAWQAEEYLAHNWDLLRDALECFGCEDSNPIEKGAEWCDVTIRCYCLGMAISEHLDELENKGFFEKEEN